MGWFVFGVVGHTVGLGAVGAVDDEVHVCVELVADPAHAQSSDRLHAWECGEGSLCLVNGYRLHGIHQAPEDVAAGSTQYGDNGEGNHQTPGSTLMPTATCERWQRPGH